MKIYCSNRFINEVQTLSKKKAYSDVKGIIKDFFFNKQFTEIMTGDRLYGPDDVPFMKKRVPDAGGYRIYYLVDVINEDVYLEFLHPKTGQLGSPNILSDFKKKIHVDALLNRKVKQNLHLVEVCESNMIKFIEYIKDEAAN